MTSLAASVNQTSSSPQTSSLPAREESTATAPRRGALWTGRVLSGLAVLFLAMDAGFKLVMGAEAAASTPQLGWSGELMPTLGVLELVCLVVYLVPRTAVLGAVLWTGYLGGAIATHVRIGDPLWSHTLFPTYVAALIWGGLWLRDRRVRALLAR